MGVGGEAGFGGAVEVVGLAAAVAGDGCDDDDVACAALFELGGGAFADGDGGGEVDVDGALGGGEVGLGVLLVVHVAEANGV